MALKSMAILCNTCKRIALCCSTCPIGRHTPDARSLDHIVNAATQPVTNAPAQRTTYRHPRLCMQPFFRRKAGDVIHHLLPPSAACSCVQRCGSGPQAVVDAVPPEVLSHARSVLRGGVPVLLGTVAVNGAVGHLHQFREAVLWWLYLCAVAILDLLSAKVLWQHRLRSLPHHCHQSNPHHPLFRWGRTRPGCLATMAMWRGWQMPQPTAPSAHPPHWPPGSSPSRWKACSPDSVPGPAPDSHLGPAPLLAPPGARRPALRSETRSQTPPPGRWCPRSSMRCWQLCSGA